MIKYLKNDNRFDVFKDIVLHGKADYKENIQKSKKLVVIVKQFEAIGLTLSEPSKKRKMKRITFFEIILNIYDGLIFRKTINNC